MNLLSLGAGIDITSVCDKMSSVVQIVGYILSGDPTYITSHNDARNEIRQIERDELLEKMVRNYIGLEG